jgi:hypothetical protein
LRVEFQQSRRGRWRSAACGRNPDSTFKIQKKEELKKLAPKTRIYEFARQGCLAKSSAE